MEILKVESLSKVYGKGDVKVKALDNVSFTVNQGEFIAIVGASRKRKINSITFNWWCRQANKWKSFYRWKRYI